MNDTETLFRTLFWSLLGAIMVMRTVFTCRVRRAGERFLPDRQAIQREVRGAFAVRFVGFFVPLTFLVLYALNVPWLAGLALPLPPWLCWAGFALGVASLAWWISTQIALVTRWSAQLQLREGHHLVTTGPYARVRHLLYTAMFGLVQQTIGPAGAIVGVDLSDAMLEQARQRIAHNGWTNVQWVCADASEFLFPSCVDAMLSTYTLTLVPEPSRVVVNSCRALAPGGRLAILDMARPRYCPLWWRHVLFFLRAYGVTAEMLKCR